MELIEKSIIKTLVYYESLGQIPLTALEICQYLQKENSQISQPSLGQIVSTLKQSSALNNYLSNKNGFFFLKNNEPFYYQRISRQKIAIAKWRKIKRVAIYLALTPFLRGLVITGSLSLNNTRPESDLDFLIITAKNRIWLCRTWLSFLLQLIGQRRHDSVIKNKVCLNQYVAEGHFSMESQNLSSRSLGISNAQLYSRSIPMINYSNYEHLQNNNSWMANFIFNYGPSKKNNLHRINEQSLIFIIGQKIARLFEYGLKRKAGDYLEKTLSRWQTNRIHKKTKSHGFKVNELFLSDHMLLFHYPICKNNEAAWSYSEKIKLLSLT